MSIDRKFQINATSRKSGTVYTEQNAVLFLAKDAALPATLRFYHQKCKRLGADEHQLEAVRLMHERVLAFQNKNGTKVPDVDPVLEASTLET